jgi:hypothetical protein
VPRAEGDLVQGGRAGLAGGAVEPAQAQGAGGVGGREADAAAAEEEVGEVAEGVFEGVFGLRVFVRISVGSGGE